MKEKELSVVVLQRKGGAAVYAGKTTYIYELRGSANGPLVLRASPASFNDLLESGAYSAAAQQLTRPLPTIVHVAAAGAKDRDDREVNGWFGLQVLTPPGDAGGQGPIELIELREPA